MLTQSPPTRGAWIEIYAYQLQAAANPGRPPHGERGLKYHYNKGSNQQALSLPTRGAWIEILIILLMYLTLSVAPHTGSVD